MRAALVGATALVWCGAVEAAEWGTIVPGESTVESVRAIYGQPSRAAKRQAGGYDTTEWVYEAARAPAGMIRMVVQFGVLKPAGYRPNVVRTFGLEPKPGVFTRGHVVRAWGKPDQGGMQDGVPLMIFESGLTVYFDKDLVNAVSMWFTAPHPGVAPTPGR